MKKRWMVLISGLLLTVAAPAGASERSLIDYGSVRNEAAVLQGVPAGSRELYGEIVAISPERLMLKGPAGTRGYQLDGLTRYYCNGRRCSWDSLRPVAPEAYFEAVVILDRQQEVLAINGFYEGEECLIRGWSRNGRDLTLQLESLSGGPALAERPVHPLAKLPEGERWVCEDQIVFVLYNRNQEIRALFLPD
jgi:hypothetical protein